MPRAGEWLAAPAELRDETMPKNIIMIGPTRVRKTEVGYVALRATELGQASAAHRAGSRAARRQHECRSLAKRTDDICEQELVARHGSGRGKRREALERYLQDVVLASFPVLAYDEAAAHWHGHERARLEGLGRPAPYVDGQIAAIALVNDLVLVTVNVRDFTRFKDIEVENWSKRRSYPWERDLGIAAAIDLTLECSGPTLACPSTSNGPMSSAVLPCRSFTWSRS